MFFYCYGNSQNFKIIDEKSFENAQFNELDFLKEDLSNVKIIALGEAAHDMGKTYTAKIKIVKYLHEKLNFNILAFESPLYNLEKLYNKRKITQIDLKSNISGVWCTSEMNELFQYIVETQKTRHPLRVIGFDESIFPDSQFEKELKNLVTDLENDNKISLGIYTAFYRAIDNVVKNCYYYSKIKKTDTLILFNKIEQLKELTKKTKSEKKQYYEFWNRIISNLQSVYRKNYKKGNREVQMAANTCYLLEKNANEKLILWGATTHLYSSPISINDTRIHKKKTMGKLLRNKFAEGYYTLVFTPYSGQFGFEGYLGLGKRKIKSKKGSLEYYIAKKYDAEYVFISLRDNAQVEEIKRNNIKSSNIVWYNGRFGNEPMNVSTVSDGIFYLRNETLINQKE